MQVSGTSRLVQDSCTSFLTVCHSHYSVCIVGDVIQDNSVWDLRMDEQIMSWAVQRPEDWQLGGRCEAFMWGGGRIGQLGEAGRAVLIPTAAQSFSCAQQVVSCARLII